MVRTTTWPSVRRCGVCGRDRRIKRAAVDGDPDMCQSCWKADRRSWRVCGRCGELRRTQGRDPEDREQVICERCYRRARPVGECDECGRTGRLARSGARGGPKLCGACAGRASRPVEPCGRCGEVRPIAVREGADGTPNLCFVCYGKVPRRVCGVCGKPGPIQVRGRDGQPDVCRRCYRPPVDRCHVCGRERPCVFAGTSEAVCWSCKPRRVDRCTLCGETKPVKAASSIGPLCEACEWRRLRAKAICERCGQLRRPALHAGGEVLCGDCAGVPQTRVCQRCGVEDVTYDRGLCAGCSLLSRLAKHVADGEPGAVAALERFVFVLERRADPLSALHWLSKPGGRTFLELLAGRICLTHDALDALPASKGTEQLRAELVHSGCLPARDETQAAFDRWLSARLAGLLPGPDAHAVRIFALWKVSRELAARRRHHGHRPDPLAAVMPRHYVTAAISLVSWLHEQTLTLEDLDQARLERWLTEKAAVSAHRAIRPFIAWIAREHHRQLRMPPTPDSHPEVAVDDQQRLAVVRDLLQDEAIDPSLRLAGCLVALYAQPVARIVRLTVDDVALGEEVATIRLGADPVQLPVALRSVAETMLAAARDGWLLPGQRPGRPIHPQHLCRRLRTVGVPVAQTRPAGLAALAHRIPAPVLADLLGMSASTTCRAAGELRVDYARYVARRT